MTAAIAETGETATTTRTREPAARSAMTLVDASYDAEKATGRAARRGRPAPGRRPHPRPHRPAP